VALNCARRTMSSGTPTATSALVALQGMCHGLTNGVAIQIGTAERVSRNRATLGLE
jgi:hypothetical protein